jgi:hypothetical protein
MKTLTFLFLFISCLSFGQRHWLGLQGGYSYNRAMMLEGSSRTNIKPGHNFEFGLNYQYTFSRRMFVGLDLLYSQRYFNNWGARPFNQDGKPYGFTDTANYQLYDHSTVQYKYHYLHLPLKFGFLFGEKVQFILGFGLAPGILINASSTFEIGYEESYKRETNTVTKEVSQFDLTFRLENGVRFILGERVSLFFSATYFQSLIPTINPDGIRDIDYNNKKMLFYGFQFSGGLQFALEGRKPYNPYFRK